MLLLRPTTLSPELISIPQLQQEKPTAADGFGAVRVQCIIIVFWFGSARPDGTRIAQRKRKWDCVGAAGRRALSSVVEPWWSPGGALVEWSPPEGVGALNLTYRKRGRRRRRRRLSVGRNRVELPARKRKHVSIESPSHTLLQCRLVFLSVAHAHQHINMHALMRTRAAPF